MNDGKSNNTSQEPVIKSSRGGRREGAGRKPGSSRPRFADGWYVYVVGEVPSAGALKVGIARNPFYRIAGLQTGNPKLLRFVAVWSMNCSDEYGTLEKAVHRALKAYSIRGEWFDVTQDIVEKHLVEAAMAFDISVERVL